MLNATPAERCAARGVVTSKNMFWKVQKALKFRIIEYFVQVCFVENSNNHGGLEVFFNEESDILIILGPFFAEISRSRRVVHD